ncbi:MAG: PKD domain-containing protein [Paludibacter sp.]
MKKYIVLFVLILSLYGCNMDLGLIGKPKACFSTTGDLNIFSSTQFSNCSENASAYFWNFGDSVFSSEKEPKHFYKLPGSYKVKLNASTDSESDTITKLLNIAIVKPSASFYFSVSSASVTILDSVKFSNYSTRSIYYKWDFGDGTYSTEVNPKHKFYSAGKYYVKLVAYNNQTADTISKSIIVGDIVELYNKAVPHGYAGYNEGGINLDIDGDGLADLYLNTWNSGGMTNESQANIEPKNNYEIFTVDTIQTFFLWVNNNDSIFKTIKYTIPKIYILGHKILNNNQVTNKYLVIAESYVPMNSSLENWIFESVWIKNEERYIGFRKVSGNITKTGWLKLKVLDYTNVILISYKIPTETESLLIDK